MYSKSLITYKRVTLIANKGNGSGTHQRTIYGNGLNTAHVLDKLFAARYYALGSKFHAPYASNCGHASGLVQRVVYMNNFIRPYPINIKYANFLF